MHPQHLEAANAFIDEFWLASKSLQRWQAALAQKGWDCCDWPEAYGGPGWSRAQIHLWIDAAASAGCPLPDERFSVIAPLVMALCPEPQRAPILQALASHRGPCEIRLSSVSTISKQGRLSPKPSTELALARADDDADGQLLLQLQGRILPLGKGRAEAQLARHQSPALNLWQAKLTSHLTQPLLADAEADAEAALRKRHAENQILVQALAALFLANASPQTQNLLSAELHQAQAAVLKDALGYYALLQTDGLLTDNEPLPRPTQRRHLKWLQTQVPRLPHLQKDQLAQSGAL